MSETPRTDAWKWSGGDDPIEEFHKFACQLERELNEARTRIKELADIGGALADHLDLDDCECSDCQQLSRPVKDWQETVKRCLEGIE